MPKVVVYHGYYGCETGCCGHYVEVDDVEIPGSFSFSHPYGEDFLDFAKDIVREQMGEDHIADLDWENCLIVDD